MAMIEAAAAEPAPKLAEAPARTTPAPPYQAGAWLAENGLAWIGGAVLGLGGLFLVSYAAQRRVFTPALRIAAAVTLGLVLIGALLLAAAVLARRLSSGGARAGVRDATA